MDRRDEHIFFVYETAQVPRLLEYRKAKGPLVVVALDREVELDLDKAGVQYASITSLAVPPIDNREVVEWTRSLALWYRRPECAFFAHEGILLGEQYEVATLYYLQTCVYFVSIFSQALDKFPHAKKVTIPATLLQVPPTADPTAKHKENLPVEVLRLMAEMRGSSVEVLDAPPLQVAMGRVRGWRRRAEALATRAAFFCLNAFITLVTRPRPIKLFATDPWSRLEPFVAGMQDVELIMSRRAEARAMGLRNIWRTRARFHHRLDYANATARAVAREQAVRMQKEWATQAPKLEGDFSYKGISFWPVARQVLDSIVLEYAEEAVASIEGVKRLFARRGVNAVVLFASTKGYNLLLARLSERLNVPSIELEHALVNDDTTLVHCRLNSRYLASYGPLINATYESWGVEPWRLISVGSPRFDEHAREPMREEVEALRAKLGLPKDALTVLYGIQQIYLSLEYGNFNSYEVWDILKDVDSAQAATPGIQLILRPRPGKWRFNFYNRKETLELFAGEWRLAQFENLKNLLALSDVVVTGGSTVILEALLMHKPVVLYLPHTLDQDWHRFEKAGAVLVARTKEQIAAHLAFLKDADARAAHIKRADAFVKENFLNDGGAARRMQELIRRVTAQQASTTMPV